MVTWGVTDAGVYRTGDGLDIEIEADDWMGDSPGRHPALVNDDHGETISTSSGVNAPLTGSTTRLTIPATTARLSGEETTRLADHTFPLSDGSYRLSCTLPSTPTVGAFAADVESTTVVTRFQGPATLDERRAQSSFRSTGQRPSRCAWQVATACRRSLFHRHRRVSPRTIGRRYESPFDDSARLCGRATETTVGADELASILERTPLPVVYNGRFHWSREVVDRI